MTALGTLPGSTGARAMGINNDGQVVGNTDFDAFVWQNGKMTALPALVPAGAGTGSGAADINNHGQIVGQSESSADGFTQHAVIWTH